MKQRDTKDVKKKIRSLLHHMRTLQGSYPQLLEDPEYAHAQLLVLRKVLPYMIHILKFAAETVPLIENVIGVTGQGSEDLSNVSKNLRNINSAAENAVQDILTELEQVEEKLRAVQQAASAGGNVEEAVEAVSMQLNNVFSALQFQDITSQKIEATHALLAQLAEGLNSLVEQLVAQLAEGLNSLVEQLGMPIEGTEIEVHEGTYDSNAEYDREKSQERQREIDALVEGGKEEEAQSADDE